MVDELVKDLDIGIATLIGRNSELTRKTRPTMDQLIKNSEKFAGLVKSFELQIRKLQDAIQINSIRHLEIAELLKNEKPKLTMKDGLFWADQVSESESIEIQSEEVPRVYSPKYTDTPVRATFKSPESDKKKQTETPDIKMQKITEYKGVKLNMSVPKIGKLSAIPNAFYWFAGDKRNPEGIYVRFGNSIILVPFPDVIDPYDPAASKNGTVKCRSGSAERCYTTKSGGVCPYAHVGDRYKKIGSNYRSEIARLGNHKFLEEDSQNAKYSDITHILMNSLSDALFCNLWFEKNISRLTVIHELEICG